MHHKSRSLVSSKMNYNKVEGNSLAIYSGVLMNHQHLYGTSFTVLIDHSALLASTTVGDWYPIEWNDTEDV